MRSRSKPPTSEVGSDPDVRYSFANERTFLAWNRTALALIATGVAATQLLPALDVRFGRRLLGLPMIAMGAFVSVSSYRRWDANERAMREGESLPPSRLPQLLAAGIAAIAVIAILIAAFGARAT